MCKPILGQDKPSTAASPRGEKPLWALRLRRGVWGLLHGFGVACFGVLNFLKKWYIWR